MSLWSRLFGGSDAPGRSKSDAPPEDYKGCLIHPTPEPVGRQYRLSARIEKEIGGETKVHHLIRADLLEDRETAVRVAVTKARQVIDEQGDGLFR